MKKIVFVLLVLLGMVFPVSAAEEEVERWSDGSYEYIVQRSGSSITLTSITATIPRAVGIPFLTGTIIGTGFTGSQHLVAETCPGLDHDAPARGTVSADGSSISVTFKNAYYDETTCVEDSDSEVEDTITYTNIRVSNTSPALPYGIRDIQGFTEALLGIEKTQKIIDACPAPRVPSENMCVDGALLQFELPGYLPEAAIEPDFTDAIILDEREAQIISFPEGTKEVPWYLLNTISTNLTDFSKDFALAADAPESFGLLSFSQDSDRTYSIVDKNGLTDVFMPISDQPNSLKWQNLVTLDRDFNSSAVEGTEKLVLDSDASLTLFNRYDKSVMEVTSGARMVVAGMTADDTIEAAMDFVSQLKSLDNQ